MRWDWRFVMTEKELIHKSAEICCKYIALEGFKEYMEYVKPCEESRKNRTQEDIDAYNECLAEYKGCEDELNRLREQVYNKSICIIPNEYIYAAKYFDWIVKNNFADTLEGTIKIYNDMKARGIIKNRQSKRRKQQIRCRKLPK